MVAGALAAIRSGCSSQTSPLRTPCAVDPKAPDDKPVTLDPPHVEDMRVLVGAIDHDFEDVSDLAGPLRSQILDPSSYAASQPWARTVRETGADGVVYASVRRLGGECVGAFRPRAVGLPHQERRLTCRWNGARVDRIFDYQTDQ
jgi:hypothetical protein